MKQFSEIQIEQVKQLSILEYLKERGHTPSRENSSYALMCSPLREDRKPSFKIDKKLNHWIDYSTGENGDIIELVKRLEGLSFVEAMKQLLEQTSFSLHCLPAEPTPNAPEAPNRPMLHAVKALGNNGALTKYVTEERKIPFELARHYLVEVYYKYPQSPRPLFAVGWKNEKEAYEIRSKYFKGSIGAKALSLISGVGEQQKRINLFEGYFDFLSYQTYYQLQEPVYDTLILNSITHMSQALNYIQEKGYQRINLFLDNDKAGKKASESILQATQNEACNNLEIVHYCSIYQDYKDFNEFWVGQVNQEKTQEN